MPDVRAALCFTVNHIHNDKENNPSFDFIEDVFAVTRVSLNLDLSAGGMIYPPADRATLQICSVFTRGVMRQKRNDISCRSEFCLVKL